MFIIDLTRYGVEPNPGPKGAKAKQPKKKKTTTSHQPVLKVVQAQPRKTKTQGWVGDAASSVGKAVAGPLGGYLFQKAGDWFGKITGLGAYEVKQNSVLSLGPALFNGDRSWTVSHRECLGDITGSTAFSSTTYAINPGLAATFPWASSMSCCYQQYQLLGCVFEFRSTSATAVNSTNTALGTVIMATNYDLNAPAFTGKIQMEASEFATSSGPNQSFCHPIECAIGETTIKSKYLRSGPVPSSGNNQFYDHGNFTIATVGQQAASVIGELWVTYHIKLLKPIISNVRTASAHFITVPTTTDTFAGLVNRSGGTIQAARTTASQVTLTNVSVGSKYEITCTAFGTSVNWANDFTIISGATALTYYNSGTHSATNAANSTRFLASLLFVATSSTIVLSLVYPTAGTYTTADFFVTPFETTILSSKPPSMDSDEKYVCVY